MCKRPSSQSRFPGQSRFLAGIVGIAVILSVSACAVTSHVLVGAARVPMLPQQVQLFLEPPTTKYREIAIIDTSSEHSLSLTAVGKADVVIRRLKEEAAKLGANGMVLQDITDDPLGSVSTAVGTEVTGVHGTLGVGVFGVGLLSRKFGRGVAIYVE